MARWANRFGPRKGPDRSAAVDQRSDRLGFARAAVRKRSCGCGKNRLRSGCADLLLGRVFCSRGGHGATPVVILAVVEHAHLRIDISSWVPEFLLVRRFLFLDSGPAMASIRKTHDCRGAASCSGLAGTPSPRRLGWIRTCIFVHRPKDTSALADGCSCGRRSSARSCPERADEPLSLRVVFAAVRKPERHHRIHGCRAALVVRCKVPDPGGRHSPRAAGTLPGTPRSGRPASRPCWSDLESAHRSACALALGHSISPISTCAGIHPTADIPINCSLLYHDGGACALWARNHQAHYTGCHGVLHVPLSRWAGLQSS